jgi:outer membrane lipoprotein-sorting protein
MQGTNFCHMLFGSRQLILAVCVLFPAASFAAPNRYDIFARVLQPYLTLFFSKPGGKAVEMEVVVRSIEGGNAAAYAAIVNQPVKLSFQGPDKLRVEVTNPDHRKIVCRSGQRVWVYPRELGAEVVATASNAEKNRQALDFRLPLNDQEIVLLPALFRVTRFNSVTDSRGSPAWDIEFRTDPTLEKELKASPVVIGALVRQNDYGVEHVKMRSGVWSGEMEVSAVRFSKQLPQETWEPSADLVAEVVELPPGLLSSALKKVSNLNIQ